MYIYTYVCFCFPFNLDWIVGNSLNVALTHFTSPVINSNYWTMKHQLIWFFILQCTSSIVLTLLNTLYAWFGDEIVLHAMRISYPISWQPTLFSHISLHLILFCFYWSHTTCDQTTMHNQSGEEQLHNFSSDVLHSLERTNPIAWNTVQQWITIVQSCCHKWVNKLSCCRIKQ